MSTDTFAVTVTRDAAAWHIRRAKVAQRPADITEDLSQAVRNMRSEGPAFAIANIENDFFIVIRPVPGGTRLYISDALAATYDEIAQAVLDAMDADIPEVDSVDDADPWPLGDDDILADLGLSDQVLDIISGDPDAWPAEQIQQIAEEMGFDEELDALLG
ncbi:tRNA adenosine deaminase-associated protein [Corynebacterium caspium]|uniref:tRNA adenosine deaminase-associated protein n=1 Tax=Corynebacterium caspium TaxID=234828 RepID=UPI000360F1CB|nr:tRNA adenosine deaminase-associated protein [Corynebacterium caspium]WKD58527.1 hypothetical protein CCASP_00475 [Corynebacterium caspium DSM 44850]